MTLYADIDGKPVPLRSCDWVQTEKCGCIIAVAMAQLGDDVIAATAEQAHKELVPTKRERDKDNRLGRTFTLMSHEAFKERTKRGDGSFDAWACAEHGNPLLPAPTDRPA